MTTYEHIYEYSRDLTSGCFLIDNIDRKDGEENQLFLSQEILVAFPLKKFRTFGEENIYICAFENELTTEEKTQLDAIIAAHKTNIVNK